MKLPKIKISSILNKDNNLFLTDTDDLGFARNQVKQIDTRIKVNRDHSLKPWERSTNNNIYSCLDRKTKFIVRDTKKNVRTQNISYDWNKQDLFSQTEADDIKRSEVITKQIKTKYEIKYKHKVPNITASDFITTRNDTFLTNTMINLLKEEKKNIIKNGESYSNALKYEIKSLEKDIDKFNDFVIKTQKKNQESELLLLKAIADNKNLVELYKAQLQEYNSTIYEVYKHIKLIGNLKHYATFIHKLLGGDNDILHCDIPENLNFKEFKNKDIFSLTQNIIKSSKNILKNDKLIDEFDLEDPITINNFDLTFKMIEEKIMKVFIQKEKYISEMSELERKTKLNEEVEQKKCDSLQQDYDNQKEELDSKILDINQVKSAEENELLKFFYELLIDIYSLLFGKTQGLKDLKIENASDVYKSIVIPVEREITKKETSINKLSKVMENYSKENNALFTKILLRRKAENRALKLYNEKEQIKINDEIRNKKLNEKMRKIIIKGRYKYNLTNPPQTTKRSLNKVIKSDFDSDYWMLIYK